MSTGKKRTGVYLPKELIESLDAYARHRGTSRNQALAELLRYVLRKCELEIRTSVIQMAIEDSQRELDIRDGPW